MNHTDHITLGRTHTDHITLGRNASLTYPIMAGIARRNAKQAAARQRKASTVAKIKSILGFLQKFKLTFLRR